MNTDDIESALLGIFRELFDDEEIRIDARTTAKDIEGWDSLTHINLVVATEQHFRIKFTTKDVNGLANVGEFISLIARKLAS